MSAIEISFIGHFHTKRTTDWFRQARGQPDAQRIALLQTELRKSYVFQLQRHLATKIRMPHLSECIRRASCEPFATKLAAVKRRHHKL